MACSWVEKFVHWVNEGHSQNEGGNDLPVGLQKFLDPGYDINPMAVIVIALCKESKLVRNFIAMTKMSLIIFMILVV